MLPIEAGPRVDEPTCCHAFAGRYYQGGFRRSLVSDHIQDRVDSGAADSAAREGSACAFCGVAAGKEAVGFGKVLYCCERCYHKSLELADAHARLEEAYWQTLHALAAALDARESATGAHSRRVAEITGRLAEAMGCNKAQQDDFYRAALLHDIGKIGVPDSILLKPGPLSGEEWKLMRLHPEIGYRILQDVSFLRPAAEIVLAHQERYDGQGYPRQLKEDDIPLGARLFAVADALDAITADRPYRKGRSLEAALREIKRGAGTQFDPKVVELLAANISRIRLSLAPERLA